MVFSRRKTERTEIDDMIDEFNQANPDNPISTSTPLDMKKSFHLFLLLFPVLAVVIAVAYPNKPGGRIGWDNPVYWIVILFINVPVIVNISFLIHTVISSSIRHKRFKKEYGELLAEIEAEERKSTENSAE